MSTYDKVELTFQQYFILNQPTIIYCLKICSITFGLIATLITIAVELITNANEHPFTVFLACELFGYGLALFIFVIAILEGYIKAKLTVRQFNKIDNRHKQQYSIELIKKPLSQKYWFMQLDIVRREGEIHHPIERQLREQIMR